MHVPSLPVIVTWLLLFVILPGWIVAGFADYWCHRASSIETTAGPKESWLHILGLVELGVPLLLAMFFEVNALVLVVMIAGLITHELTIIWDVNYADRTRRVTPTEQHIHSVLEVLPFAGFLLVLPLCWGQFCALFGFGPETADWSLQLRGKQVPLTYVLLALGSALLFDVLPFVEELLRGLRAKREDQHAGAKRGSERIVPRSHTRN